MQDKLKSVSLSELAWVNPSLTATLPHPERAVSFIAMADVSEGGAWTNRQERALRDIKSGYTPFQEDDILFAKITPCMENGKGCQAHGLLEGVGFGSTEFHVLRAKPGVEARFLYHWVQSRALRSKAESMMTGSAGQRRVPAEFFDLYQLPELPLPEQRRIAAVLDALDETIAASEALVAKLRALRQGLLHDLLTCGLDDNGELRDPQRNPEQFRDSEVGRVPRGWDLLPLAEVGQWVSGGTPNKSTPAFWDGNIPWLNPKDMKQFHISETINCVTDLGSQSGTRITPSNTVFIVVRGMILAHTFPVCISGRSMAFNQDVKAVICDEAIVFPLYFAYWLTANSTNFLGLVTESSHGTKRFDMMDILRYCIPLPSLQEQSRIIATLNSHDSRLRAEEQQLAKLRQLKAGLMDDLLSGRVRVPESGA